MCLRHPRRCYKDLFSPWETSSTACITYLPTYLTIYITNLHTPPLPPLHPISIYTNTQKKTPHNQSLDNGPPNGNNRYHPARRSPTQHPRLAHPRPAPDGRRPRAVARARPRVPLFAPGRARRGVAPAAHHRDGDGRLRGLRPAGSLLSRPPEAAEAAAEETEENPPPARAPGGQPRK